MEVLILICSLVIITIWSIWKFKYEVIRIKGESMLPTLEDGDLVLIDKRAKLGMGDIVVLTPPKEKYLVVKRITKIDTWENSMSHLQAIGYWVLGDNRDHSIDSRVYGWVIPDKIEGKVIKTWKTKKQQM